MPNYLFVPRYDADIGGHKLQDINGNWRLHDTTLGWSDQSPPFTNLNADLSLDNTKFVANITNANFGGMSVQHGNVTISPVVGDAKRRHRYQSLSKVRLAKPSTMPKRLVSIHWPLLM